MPPALISDNIHMPLRTRFPHTRYMPLRRLLIRCHSLTDIVSPLLIYYAITSLKLAPDYLLRYDTLRRRCRRDAAMLMLTAPRCCRSAVAMPVTLRRVIC